VFLLASDLSLSKTGDFTTNHLADRGTVTHLGDNLIALLAYLLPSQALSKKPGQTPAEFLLLSDRDWAAGHLLAVRLER
jgi:hypothetical protein